MEKNIRGNNMYIYQSQICSKCNKQIHLDLEEYRQNKNKYYHETCWFEKTRKQWSRNPATQVVDKKRQSRQEYKRQLREEDYE